MTQSTEIDALKRAIKIVRGQSALARAIGTKQGNIWHWLNKSLQVPAEYAPKIEAATAGEVTKQQLRPDLWPLETAASQPDAAA